MGKLFGVGSGGFWRTGFTGAGGSNFVSNVFAAFQMANASFTSVPGFRFPVLFARAIAKLVSWTVVSLAGDEVTAHKFLLIALSQLARRGGGESAFPGRASPADQAGANYGLNVMDSSQFSKAELQSGTTLEGDFLCNQGQDIGFEDASGAFASWQSPFHQRAVLGQTVNQPQRTTKTARHFGPSD
jgi:hypothetical protein